MDSKKLYRIIGFAVFIIGLAAYWSTMQNSVSFWDCGEFAASSYLLQVPHPPGTPFFILLGKLFSMIPFAQDIGYRINLISVFSTAFAGLFLYLSVVKFIENYKGKEYSSIIDALYTYIAAAIGALSFIFAETVWFNGVESEVYANSTFFIAFIFWLIAIWNEKASETDSSKYLILVAYLIGLSIGVHLMAVLAIVPIVMIVYFKKYLTDEAVLLKTSYIFAGHSALMLVVACLLWNSFTETEPPSYSEFGAIDKKLIFMFAGVSIVFMAIFWKQIFKRNSFYIPIIIGGIGLFTVYPGVVKTLPNALVKIGGNSSVLNTMLFVLVFAAVGIGIYYFRKKNKPTIELIFKCALFVMIGYTTYAQLMIRANQEVPINMNSPKTYKEALSYLNREQYGDFPIFKRRYTNEAHQQEVFTNYSSDLDFFINYQMDHMFNRYFFWNYIGRESKVQDSGVDWTKLFGIPFLIGLFGIYYQFRKDWKMGSVFLVAFIFLGYLTAFYQNQQSPQPRERDYFYVGAFFIYSMWIAFGVRGILDTITEFVQKEAAAKALKAFVIIVLFLLIPVNMWARNHWQNDRSRNYVPWDYAYNMLQSCEPDAILFTNGDNDTFPLWYLQSVAGVRRDVRIANLSLINTPWYIKQLKDTTPFGAKKIAMDLTETEIDSIRPERWDNNNVIELGVPRELFGKLGVKDTAVVRTGKVQWKFKAQAYYDNIPILRQQDFMILKIIQANNWQRPIYFAATCSDDTKVGLDQYLMNEGMAFKLTPNKVNENDILEYINEPVLRKQLLEEPQGYSKDYQPGFKFRGLNDKTIYYDENHEHMTSNFRNMYVRLTLYYLNIAKDNSMALKTLNKMEEKIPRTVIPMPTPFYKDNIAHFYLRAGDYEKYKVLALEVVDEIEQGLMTNTLKTDGQRVSPYEVLLFHYENLKQYKKALEWVTKLQAMYPKDETLKQLATKFRILSGEISEMVPKTIPGTANPDTAKPGKTK